MELFSCGRAIRWIDHTGRSGWIAQSRGRRCILRSGRSGWISRSGRSGWIARSGRGGWIACITGFLLGAAGCSSESGPPIVQPPPVTTANISGTVTDGEGPVPAVTVTLDDGTTAFVTTTATTGTFRLQLEPGSYDVRCSVAPPAQGESLQLTRVSFATTGDHRLDLRLASGRLHVEAPPSMEGDTIQVGLYWNSTLIARHSGVIEENRARVEFRALLPVPVLVAVQLPGEEAPLFPPGVSAPAAESYWPLMPDGSAESTLIVPATDRVRTRSSAR